MNNSFTSSTRVGQTRNQLETFRVQKRPLSSRALIAATVFLSMCIAPGILAGQPNYMQQMQDMANRMRQQNTEAFERRQAQLEQFRRENEERQAADNVRRQQQLERQRQSYNSTLKSVAKTQQVVNDIVVSTIQSANERAQRDQIAYEQRRAQREQRQLELDNEQGSPSSTYNEGNAGVAQQPNEAANDEMTVPVPSNGYAGILGQKSITVIAAFDEDNHIVTGHMEDNSGHSLRFEGDNKIQGTIQIRLYSGDNQIGTGRLVKDLTSDQITWSGGIRMGEQTLPITFARARGR